MPLLRRLINCFEAVGRHRLYRNLLRVVTHAGVRGLLVHDVKNEIDRALKVRWSPQLQISRGQGASWLYRLV